MNVADVGNTCGSGICQQAGTSTAQKGIRCLRKMSSALCACPCSSPQLFSNSSISMWLARRRAGEQFLSNSPAQEPQEGQGQEERDTHRKGVNCPWWSIYTHHGQDLLLHSPGQGQHFRLDRRPGAVSS